MAKGILKSFEKRMKEGVHETWKNDKGTYYKFNLTFTIDGADIVGDAMSSKEQPSWKIGTEYEFEKNSRTYQGMEYFSFKGMKDPNSTFGGGGGAKPNPAFNIQKIFEAAVECTIAYFKAHSEHYNEANEETMLGKVWVALLQGDEARRWINISAMRLVIQKMDLFDKSITTSAWLFLNTQLIADNMEATVKAQVDHEKANPPK